MLQGTSFHAFIRNSAIIATITVLIVLVFAISTAYVNDVLRPHDSCVSSVLILARLAMPAIAILARLFRLIQTLGLFDKFWGVVVPPAGGSIPFGVLLSGDFIRAVPIQIYEASKINGASFFPFLISILIPLCRPVLAAVAIFTFLRARNEYVLPLVFIQTSICGWQLRCPVSSIQDKNCSRKPVPTFHPHLEIIVVSPRHPGRAQSPTFGRDLGYFRIAAGKRPSTTDQ